MRSARVFLALAVLLVSVAAAAQSKRSSPGLFADLPDLSDVVVRVMRDDNRAAENVRVELQSSLGVPIGESITNSQGQAFFRQVSSGGYRVKVDGRGIETTLSEFTIHPRQGYHSESVRVRTVADNAGARPASAVVPAADLKAPEEAQKEFAKGNEALLKKQYGPARKHYERAIELHPAYPSALNNLGLALIELKLPADARVAFQRAIQQDDRFVRPYLGLGRLLIMEKDWENAEAALLKGAALEPNNADTLTMLCNAQLRIGKLDDVVLNAGRVHALEHSRFAFAHFLSAVALQNKSMPAEAAAEYRVYLQESPNGPNAESAKKALAKLQ